ncbi:S-layer homology domain-containing protein, partial [Pseudoflavonifractor phocaeensis]|uniref:S-layer homology domain-containing protein n=1 Tax=Pseudoflavonifractor phocaeensis TaxID=1870988 RepID=UPI001F1A3485
TYTATFTESWAAEQTKDVQDIPVLTHTCTWSEPTYKWAEDGKSCTAERVCTKDDTHKETATATITSAEKTPATETEKGWTTYTATFTESWAAEQTKDVQDIPVLIPIPTTYTVTFDSKGGSAVAAQTIEEGQKATKPADPTKDGYTFKGWTLNGSAYDFSTPVTDNITLVATWQKNSTSGSGGGGGGVSTYAITVDSAKNGDVTTSHKTASKGTTVTLTVEPDKGYTLETITVTDKNGDEIELTNKGDGKYTFKMPASKVYVEVTFMEDNSMLNFFVDVPADAYYYDAVLWAAKNGITGGVDDTHFAPNATCTRAQAVTFLWRAAGSPAPKSSEMPFEDVAAGSYYYDAVLWAVENGITDGTSATTFSPDAVCSRGQIVTFLWRSQKSPASDSVNPFADVAADAYYNSAVLWAVTNGITDGTSATTFSPAANCTRAQIVTFLYRCLG